MLRGLRKAYHGRVVADGVDLDVRQGRQGGAMRADRPEVAGRELGLLAFAFAALLIAVSNRYGYHRDELYFIAIGRRPAFGYVDQPPLVPLLAHAMDAICGHSLLWLRVPSAIAGAVIVVVTGLIAREFGAARRAQLFAAACMAVSGVLLAVSHLMSTTTYDILGWTVLSWLVIRGLRDSGPVWIAAGAVAGIALEVKTLPAFFLFALLVGVLVAGPRGALRSRWLWAGAAIAALMWLPNLWWQAAHGWPQVTLARAVASGSSGTSQSRWLFVPMQFLLLGPPLAPVWIAGLVRLTRSRWRFFAVAYGVLVAVFVVTDGKPYYLCGMYPVLFAAAAEPTLRWAARVRARAALLGVAVASAFATAAVITLPITPASTLHDTPIVAMNYDAGETVGWPRFADTLTRVVHAQPADTMVLTSNYGEAGAMLRLRPEIGHAYARQNSMWDLGPPPGGTTTAVVIGFSQRDRTRWFAQCHQAARIDNGLDVDNDEQGRLIYVCTGPRGLWSTIWRQMRRFA